MGRGDQSDQLVVLPGYVASLVHKHVRRPIAPLLRRLPVLLQRDAPLPDQVREIERFCPRNNRQ